MTAETGAVPDALAGLRLLERAGRMAGMLCAGAWAAVDISGECLPRWLYTVLIASIPHMSGSSETPKTIQLTFSGREVLNNPSESESRGRKEATLAWATVKAAPQD